MEYRKTSLSANYYNAVWVSQNMGKLAKVIGNDDQQLKNYINTTLCFDGFEEDILKAVFEQEWLESCERSKPADEIELFDVEITDNTLTLSMNLQWHNIPISSKALENEDEFQNLLDWPTDLLDEIFFNEEGIALLDDDDIEEQSVGEKNIFVDIS